MLTRSRELAWDPDVSDLHLSSTQSKSPAWKQGAYHATSTETLSRSRSPTWCRTPVKKTQSPHPARPKFDRSPVLLARPRTAASRSFGTATASPVNIANYNPRASSGDLCSYRCPNPNPILVLDGNLCAARPDQFKDRNIRGFGFPRPSSIDVVELAAAGDKKQPVFDARRVKRLNRTTRSREEFKLETLRSKREFQERKNEFEPKAPRRDMSEAAFDPDRLLATRLDPCLNTASMIAHQRSASKEAAKRTHTHTKLNQVSALIRCIADRPSLHDDWDGIDPDAELRDPDSDPEDTPPPSRGSRANTSGVAGRRPMSGSTRSPRGKRRSPIREAARDSIHDMDLTASTPAACAEAAFRDARAKGLSEEDAATEAGLAAGGCVVATEGNLEEARLVADRTERELAPGITLQEEETMRREEAVARCYKEGVDALQKGEGHQAVMWFDACLVEANQFSADRGINKFLRKAYRGMIKHEEAVASIQRDMKRSGLLVTPDCKGLLQQGTCHESFEEMSLKKQTWAHNKRLTNVLQAFGEYMKEVGGIVLDHIFDKTFARARQ